MVRTYDQEQRSAVCYSTWREGKKSEIVKNIDTLHKSIKDQIRKEESQVLVSAFQHEIDDYVDKSWNQESQGKFAFIYASCRKDGNSKDDSNKIAKSAITRETRDYSVEILRKTEKALKSFRDKVKK